MSVINCLARLRTAGKISDQQYNDARAIYEGMLTDDLFRNMDQATREAHAALAAAKAIEDRAAAKKVALARKAVVYKENLGRVDSHPDGPIAGYMALYDRDVRNAPGHRINVTSLEREHYAPMIAQKMHDFDSAYRSTMGGLKQDKLGIRDMIRELFGVKTGSKTAEAAAKGWTNATDYGVKQAKALGREFPVDDEWRVPQFWTSDRVNKFKAPETKADILKHIQTGGIKIMDPLTGTFAKRERWNEILDSSIRNIQNDLSRSAYGTSSVFKEEARTFRFQKGEAGADAYLALMDKYGMGQGNYYAMMQGHAQSMARELALVHIMGPQPGAMGDQLLKDALEKHANLKTDRREGIIPERKGAAAFGDKALSVMGIENPVIAERLNDYMLGRLTQVGNRVFAGFMAGLRSFFASTNLGSAVVSAIPGDTVNFAMAAGFRGLDAGRIVADVGKEFLHHSADREAIASRLGVVSHAATRTAIGTKQFGDQLFGTGPFQRAADFVVRAQRLHAWDSAIATAFPMEFMASIADRAGKGFDELDAPFKRFLTDYGFTPAEWGAMSKMQLLEGGGTKFAMPDSLEGALRAKLMSAVGDEKQFAYLAGGSNRVHAMTAGSGKAGTFLGETSRGFYMFKTFPMSMILTHGIRAAQEASGGKWGQAAQLFIGMTIAGAIAVEAKQVIQGKDPRNLKEPAFWGEAALQGGALGIYGDLLRDTFTRTGTGLGETLSGPFGQIPAAIGELGGAITRTAVDGKPQTIGAALARDVQRFTPGNSLWYTKLLFSRLIVDNLQRMVDPKSAGAFARAQKRAMQNTGQAFWWAPGDNAPARGPDMGAMFH